MPWSRARRNVQRGQLSDLVRQNHSFGRWPAWLQVGFFADNWASLAAASGGPWPCRGVACSIHPGSSNRPWN